ncbi:hypothetical protein ACIGW3_04420 [Streptomyces sp. NPDC053499]|uniref:hypothetical protein n=1 Tax=Streptomyces sp. NPDC053499 TaxID=3365707 RepID=UPI0037D5BCE1
MGEVGSRRGLAVLAHEAVPASVPSGSGIGFIRFRDRVGERTAGRGNRVGFVYLCFQAGAFDAVCRRMVFEGHPVSGQIRPLMPSGAAAR